MAKVTIRDMPLKEAAKILAQSGITLDTHQLPDGTYRAYVRKDKKTMKAYLWLVCGQEYDQAHPRS